MGELVKINKEKVSKYILEAEINDLEIIQFLKLNLDKDLILHDVNTYNFTYTVKETEKSKSYVLPATLFDLLDEEIEDNEELNTNQESNSYKQSPIIKIFFNHNKDIIKISLGIIIGIILIKGLSFSNANILTNIDNNGQLSQTGIVQVEKEEIKIKNDFEILTEKANKNREVIAQELQEQKRLRDLLNISIGEVKKFEKTNNEIRQNLILLSQ